MSHCCMKDVDRQVSQPRKDEYKIKTKVYIICNIENEVYASK